MVRSELSAVRLRFSKMNVLCFDPIKRQERYRTCRAVPASARPSSHCCSRSTRFLRVVCSRRRDPHSQTVSSIKTCLSVCGSGCKIRRPCSSSSLGGWLGFRFCHGSRVCAAALLQTTGRCEPSSTESEMHNFSETSARPGSAGCAMGMAFWSILTSAV